jgi:hypothetical protein
LSLTVIAQALRCVPSFKAAWRFCVCGYSAE